MDFITVKNASERWNITPRRITTLCEKGRIDGAVKAAGVWILPSDAVKPADARLKNGKYVGWREKKDLCEYSFAQNLKNVEATLQIEGMKLSKSTKEALMQIEHGIVSSQQLIAQLKQKYTARI